MTKRWAWVLAALLALGMGPVEAQTRAASPQDPRAAIEATMDRYARMLLTGSNPDSAITFYAADAELKMGMETFKGRDAILAFLRDMSPMLVKSIELHTDSLSVRDSVAMHLASYTEVAGFVGGEAHAFAGSYRIKWKRETDGVWRWGSVEILAEARTF